MELWEIAWNMLFRVTPPKRGGGWDIYTPINSQPSLVEGSSSGGINSLALLAWQMDRQSRLQHPEKSIRQMQVPAVGSWASTWSDKGEGIRADHEQGLLWVPWICSDTQTIDIQTVLCCSEESSSPLLEWKHQIVNFLLENKIKQN